MSIRAQLNVSSFVNQSIKRVRCLSSREGIVQLRQAWSQPSSPPLFWGNEEAPLANLEPLPAEEVAMLSGYQILGDNVRFLASGRGWPERFKKNTRLYFASSLNEWAHAIGSPEWEMRPRPIQGSQQLTLEVPMSKLAKHGAFSFKFVTADRQWLEVHEAAPNREIIEPGRYNFVFEPNCRGDRLFRFEIPAGETLAKQNVLVWNDGEHRAAWPIFHPGDLLELGSDKAMGAMVEGERTLFRVFSPRASQVILELSETTSKQDFKNHSMQASEDGSWEIDFPTDLSGHLYRYRVAGPEDDESAGFDFTAPILDPYARASLSRSGPGVVISPDRLPSTKTPFEPPPMRDLVIVECHLRDLLAESTLPLSPIERMGFSGLRKWALDKGNYLRSLGVNAIELQPVQEFDSLEPEEYHWGYMPVNYFAPASAYSRDPVSGSGIEELRAVVEAFHESGIAVVLDVVYNHVGIPAHLALLDKAYYFDHDESLEPRNWSGCGNDLRRNAPMTRRLIVDSLVRWVEEFDVDGFRFDLAELLEFPLLKEIESALRKVKPSVLLIAEPWSFRGRIDEQLGPTSYSSWNDGFRDFIRDYVQGKGDADGVIHYLKGSPGNAYDRPCQSVNYVESHDDHCFIDEITENHRRDGRKPTDLDKKRARLAIGLTLFALGVPMLAAGQDFLRSKSGHGNTYRRGDLNVLDYKRFERFADLHRYCGAWVSFRLSEKGEMLRWDKYPDDSFWQEYRADQGSAAALLLNANRESQWPQCLFAINPHEEEAPLSVVPEALGTPTLLATVANFSHHGLDDKFQRSESGEIVLPPTELALWQIQ